MSNDKPIIYDAKGLTLKKYSWDRIMTSEDFVTCFEGQGGKLFSNTRETLLNSQFVFAFAETEYSELVQTNINDTTGMLVSTMTVVEATEVLEVDIIRLKFEVDGETYNLGVVSDKTTADDIAGGGADSGLGFDIAVIEDMFAEFTEKISKVIAIVLFVVLFAVLVFIFGPVVKRFFKLLFKGFEIILAALFTVLTYLIVALFNRKRK